MKIVPFQKKPDRSFLIKIPALFLAVLATFSACSGSNNTSSTPIPLPNGQAGSLITANGNLADCFAITSTSSLTLCTSSTSSAAGSEGVTALNTFVSSSSLPVLVVGANNGAVNVVPNVDSTSSSPIPCTTSSSPTYAISAVTGVATSSSGANIFAASGNTLYGFTYSSSSSSCTDFNPPSISISSGTITGLGIFNNVLFGVTSSGSYFTISGANTLNGLSSFATSLKPLPNYPVSGPAINGMAIDPNGLVFFADASTNTANNGGQITIYHVSSSTPYTLSPNNVQSYSGNNNGVAMSDPIGIAVSETTITNPNYCSTAPCDYIYLLNIGNSIQQYVMPVPTPINGGVSINPFNLPYTGCEMTDPVALTSFPALNQSPFSTQSQTGPFVFLGNKSLSSLGPCSGATTYGNNVVSYGITGQ